MLDLGTCSGSQAFGLARRGYNVVGSDVSNTALAQANAFLARPENAALKLGFVHDDIIDTRFQDNQFDLILDRSCYHSICYFSHRAHVIQVRRILRPGGIVLLKAMSVEEGRFNDCENIDGVSVPMPYKFSTEKLREVFAEEFEILDLRNSFFYSTVTKPPAKAVLIVLRNRET